MTNSGERALNIFTGITLGVLAPACFIGLAIAALGGWLS